MVYKFDWLTSDVFVWNMEISVKYCHTVENWFKVADMQNIYEGKTQVESLTEFSIFLDFLTSEYTQLPTSRIKKMILTACYNSILAMN